MTPSNEAMREFFKIYKPPFEPVVKTTGGGDVLSRNYKFLSHMAPSDAEAICLILNQAWEKFQQEEKR